MRKRAKPDPKRQRRKMIRELDAATRLKVFDRDNWACLRCGSPLNLQWAHVLSRRHKNVRWDLYNSMTLCAGCHLFWHHEPIIAIDWFRKKFPERYELLTNYVYSEVGQKFDIKRIWEIVCKLEPSLLA